MESESNENKKGQYYFTVTVNKGAAMEQPEVRASQQKPEDLSSGGGKAPPGGHINYPAK